MIDEVAVATSSGVHGVDLETFLELMKHTAWY